MGALLRECLGLACAVLLVGSLARYSSLEMSSKSGTFFKDDRRSVMALVDCTADWFNFAYSMISRCTRALSLSSFSRLLHNSAIRSSISSRAVLATLCISEPSPLRLSCEFERLGGRLRSYAVGLEKSRFLKGCRQRPAAGDVLSYPARFRTIQICPKDLSAVD
jgi:hypothetical protein